MKMKNQLKSLSPFLWLLAIVYIVLWAISLNYCYFWDAIQQVSKEAHWFYFSDFSGLIIPSENEWGVSATGYHPPLMGMMTAALWKIFGYKLWVSHTFMLLWAALLLYSGWRLFSSLFPKKYVGVFLFLVLLEPAVLSQFTISSPDFIMFAAFVMALWGIFGRKPVWLGVGVFFLCAMNMRGVFAGAALLIANIYYNYLQTEKKLGWKLFIRTLTPYLPAFFVLLAYFAYYFIQKGWFFSNSNYSEHYAMPHDIKGIVKHLFAFVLRSVESGRFIIWGLALLLVFSLLKKKKKRLSHEEKAIGLFALLMIGLYFLFVFITQMPFSPRYFSIQFFAVSILALSFLVRHFDEVKVKVIAIVIFLFTVSGHFWIYPESISKPWDCTLAHLPYYELRKQCFDYIEEQQIDYNDLSAGFCLYGNRGHIELANSGKVVSGNDLSKRYFIYSTISNLEDESLEILKDQERWKPVKTFEKWPVLICIYERVDVPETGE